jgi:hypothetical protein
MTSIAGRVPITADAAPRIAGIRDHAASRSELAIEWLLRRREMPRYRDHGAPDEQRQRRRDREAQSADVRAKSSRHRDDRGDKDEQEADDVQRPDPAGDGPLVTHRRHMIPLHLRASVASQKVVGIRSALHPGWLRCSSPEYSRYSGSSRLAIRAHRSSRCHG